MIGVNNLLHRDFRDSFVYDTDAQTYFTRAGITDTTEKNAYNTFALALKATPHTVAGTFYSAFIAWHNISPTSYGASLYNSISSSFDLTGGVAPSFSTTKGHTYNGSTQYLDTQIIPSTHITNTNGWMVMQYAPSDTSNTCTRWGCINGTTKQMRGAAQSGSNTMQLSAYDTTTVSGASASTSGRFYWTKSSGNSRILRRNTTTITNNVAVAGGTITDVYKIYIGARNNAGTADLFIAGNVACFGVSNVVWTEAELDTLDGLIATLQANIVSGGR